MADVRPRISPTLANLLRTGAAMHNLPTIGAYLENVVLPMVQADIHRQMTINPTLQRAQLTAPDVAPRPSTSVPVPTTGGADVVADVVGGEK
jgi:hypothetical protein